MASKKSTPSSKAAPKVVAKKAAAPKVIGRDQIAVRAFEISCGPNCGSPDDNWFRAERELRGGL